MDEKKDKANGPDRDRDLKEVTRAWGPMEAEVVKNFLESHGVTCLIRGRTVPFVYPFTVDGLAEFKIFVEARNYDTAKALLADLPESGGGGAEEEPQ